MLRNKRFWGMAAVFSVFSLMALLLLLERAGIGPGKLPGKDPYLSEGLTPAMALAQEEKTALVITDLSREDCRAAYAQFQQILLDMKVGYDTADLGTMPCPSGFDPYVTVVVLTPDLEKLEKNTLELTDWIFRGGHTLFAMTMENSAYSDYILQKSGVIQSGDFVEVEDIWFGEDYILGGGTSYPFPDGFDSALAVSLREDTEVFSRIDDESGIPLLWRCAYGKGRMVVANYGFYEKSVRGLYSAAYTLLEDVAAYPVLNAAVVFLDDMPSPVPEGYSEYITRDFHSTIADYYSSRWFPDISYLSEEYGFPLVGLVVENYENATDGTVVPQKNAVPFSYYGNLILRSGGELGYHGYNHQPLCLPDTDYGGEFDYRTWESVDAMDQGFAELQRFTSDLFPDAVFSTYVPPSNILSPAGRSYLGSLYPKIRTISGTYFPSESDLEYVHEFTVAEDGIVELPRITYGSLSDPFTQIAALSELNFHMAFSHFIHPDDALDPDRGAELGWEQLRTNLDGFFHWLQEAAPDIRKLDAADFSGAIQRWAQLTVEKQWEDGNTLKIHLGNFEDAAYLQLRFNRGIPEGVKGGTLTKLTDTLYLLEAQQNEITLEWS